MKDRPEPLGDQTREVAHAVWPARHHAQEAAAAAGNRRWRSPRSAIRRSARSNPAAGQSFSAHPWCRRIRRSAAPATGIRNREGSGPRRARFATRSTGSGNSRKSAKVLTSVNGLKSSVWPPATRTRSRFPRRSARRSRRADTPPGRPPALIAARPATKNRRRPYRRSCRSPDRPGNRQLANPLYRERFSCAVNRLSPRYSPHRHIRRC